MTYHKFEPNEISLNRKASASTSTMKKEEVNKQKPLNDEITLKNRIRCSKALAKTDRINSTLRNDAEETTDYEAFNEMFDYLKSDTKTLDKHNESEVAAFYAGRSIFITGASGFVGKVSAC